MLSFSFWEPILGILESILGFLEWVWALRFNFLPVEVRLSELIFGLWESILVFEGRFWLSASCFGDWESIRGPIDVNLGY